ncbi:MAG: thiamine pyrophosphate-binding protein [Alphaproteobacteria bacterium]
MNTRPNTRTGGRILVDALKIHGVDTVFCIPGESYIAAIDAFYDDRDTMRIIVGRHEGGVGFMAEAYGKLTGKPGVAFVTRGPGACNASIGVHTAMQDSTPMVMFVGQVAREAEGREGFQEVDYRSMFRDVAKWVTQVETPDRLPEVVSRAFHLAMSGRPGPVVVALPEDMLVETSSVADAARYRVVRPSPGAVEMLAMRSALQAAERPLVIAGGGGWSAEACADLRAFVEANRLPLACAFRTLDLLDNTNPHYVGEAGVGINPKLAKRITEADLILAIGARLGEATTSGYTLLSVPTPKQKLIHVHADPDELGSVYRPDVAINSGMGQFAAAARLLDPVDPSAWRDWLAAARQDCVEWTTPGSYPGKLDMGVAIAAMRDAFPPETIICTDAGNFAGWASRFWPFRRFRTQLGPTNGAMGYGVPAAVAAAAARPDVPVVCFAGDGGVIMTGNELATAQQFGLKFLLVIVNNGLYGTIRMYQERDYPGRNYLTDLVNPDFVAWARAFGAHAERVSATADFAPALARAQAAPGVAVLELMIDPDQLSPAITATGLRAMHERRRAEGRR